MEFSDLQEKSFDFDRRKEAVKWAYEIVKMTEKGNITEEKFWGTVRDVEEFLQTGQAPQNEALAEDKG